MSLVTFLEGAATEARRHATKVEPLAAAKSRHPALAVHTDIGGLLAALDLRSPLGPEERDALVTAIVREAQTAPHALWQALLLVAFTPMLRRLRTRIAAGRADDELDQRVLFAFLETVRAIVPSTYTALALRWGTEKRIFRAIRTQVRAPRMLELDDETHAVDPFELEAESKATFAEIARIVEGAGGEELLDVLLATAAGDEKLREYVARTYTGRTKKGFAAEYHRLCRARARLVRELRARFGARVAA
jgi:hypothetical protein